MQVKHSKYRFELCFNHIRYIKSKAFLKLLLIQIILFNISKINQEQKGHKNIHCYKIYGGQRCMDTH